jgi:flagellar biosynthesis anti-sigma factor FlgM
MRNVMNNTNKISSYTTNIVQGPTATTLKPNREDKAGMVKDQEATADRVELSKGYQDLVQMKKVMASRNEVRTDKIEQIRGQLANGTYKINPEETAGKMLDEMI